jgi:hypothetical protein
MRQSKAVIPSVSRSKRPFKSSTYGGGRGNETEGSGGQGRNGGCGEATGLTLRQLLLETLSPTPLATKDAQMLVKSEPMAYTI